MTVQFICINLNLDKLLVICFLAAQNRPFQVIFFGFELGNFHSFYIYGRCQLFYILLFWRVLTHENGEKNGQGVFVQLRWWPVALQCNHSPNLWNCAWIPLQVLYGNARHARVVCTPASPAPGRRAANWSADVDQGHYSQGGAAVETRLAPWLHHEQRIVSQPSESVQDCVFLH